MPETTSTAYTAIPLIALAVLIAMVGFAVARGLGVRGAGLPRLDRTRGAHAAAQPAPPSRQPRRGLRAGLFLWPLPFAGFLVLLAIMISQGSVEADAGWLDIAGRSALIALFGGVTLLCGTADDRIASLAPRPRVALVAVRDITILIIVALIGVFVLDSSWNAEEIREIGIFYYVFSHIVVLALLAIAYFLGQRTGILCCLVLIACLGFGVAQHFVVEFKAAAILPSDLLAIGTAADVGAGYSYLLTIPILDAITLTAAGLGLLSFIRPVKRVGLRGIAVNAGANLALAGAVTACFFGYFNATSLERDLGISYNRWQPIETYRSIGFIPAFITVLQDLEIPRPDAYSDAQAQELEEGLSAAYDAGEGTSPERAEASVQFGVERPAVIAVMNETFSDLSIYDSVRAAGYEGPTYFNSISDGLVKGTFMAPVHGGGTANSEFEFLTGNSMAFIGGGKYPYQLYDFTTVDSLPRQLSQIGYETTATHPMLASNWNRRGAYHTLGFDTFLDATDFEGAPGYHAGATDRVTYDRILQILRDDADPQFILDVTIQNHGGYWPGSVPEEDLPGITPEGLSDDIVSQLNTYLACINRSEADLAYFIEELRSIGRPVVLVFFGDHQPTFSRDINDATHLGEDQVTHEQRIYQTPFLIWANYDVASRTQESGYDEVGGNALGALTLDLIGAPLTDRQKATLAARSEVVSTNANGYLGADGLRYAIDDPNSPYAAMVDAQQRIQYLEFARKLR